MRVSALCALSFVPGMVSVHIAHLVVISFRSPAPQPRVDACSMLLSAATCFVWWIARSTSPGVARELPRAHDASSQLDAGGQCLGACKHCGRLRPQRAKHCHECGFCVLRFDHHCIWLDRCIGQGNLAPFFVLLLVGTATAAFHVASACTGISTRLWHFNAILVQTVPLPPFLLASAFNAEGKAHRDIDVLSLASFSMMAHPDAMAWLGFAMMMLCIVGGLLLWTGYLASINITWYEWRKARSLPGPDQRAAAVSGLRQAYDHGLVKNLGEVVGGWWSGGKPHSS